MIETIRLTLDCTLALLALINPISKIFIIFTLSKTGGDRDLRAICVKASFAALAILLVFTLIGNFLLVTVFHVQIYSFKMAGGLVLLLRGFDALNKGIFFDLDAKQKLEDISIVPLASPMIAGPATITASVSFPVKYGLAVTAVSIIIAVAMNLAVMLLSRRMGDSLMRHNLMGALIRITGLIVATIGIQMALDGLREYINTL